jgi:post-segregation antitoxin (ccd killing protein)
MSDSNEKFVPLNVKIPKSQKEQMKNNNFNLSAFTRSALAKQLEKCEDEKK